MSKTLTPASLLLSRITTWCGITVSATPPPTLIRVKGRPIARLISHEAVEVVLCGSLRDQIDADQFEQFPDGFWPRDNNQHVLIDLTAPGGLEEAVRMILNVYMFAQSSQARLWWFRETYLNKDPECEGLRAAVINYRIWENRL